MSHNTSSPTKETHEKKDKNESSAVINSPVKENHENHPNNNEHLGKSNTKFEHNEANNESREELNSREHSLEKKDKEKSPEKQVKDKKDKEPNPLKKERDDLILKNQELDKTLEKLVGQNEKLSKEIKDLREQIMSALEKNKKKKAGVKAEHEEHDPNIKRLKLKIDFQAKEIQTYQKELIVLQEKTDGKKTQERITDLENNLRFKEAELEKLNLDKKTLEEIRKSHQNIIESIKTEKDYNNKVSLYQVEIRKLKEEIREQRKKEEEYEKDQRKQHEYLSVLEQRYREACKRTGVSSSLNFTRAEKQNEDFDQHKKSIEFKGNKPFDNKQLSNNDKTKSGNKTTDQKGKPIDPKGKPIDPKGKPADPKGKSTDPISKSNDPKNKLVDQKIKPIDPKNKTNTSIDANQKAVNDPNHKTGNEHHDDGNKKHDEHHDDTTKKLADLKKTTTIVEAKDKKTTEQQKSTTDIKGQKSTTDIKGNQVIKSEKSLLKIKENKEKLPREVTEANYKNLLKTYQEISGQRQVLNKKHKQQEEVYLIKIKELELDHRVLSNKLKEKETEANIAISRLNEIKRLAKQASLPTMDLVEKSFIKNPEYNTKRPLIKLALDTKHRKAKREVIGDTSSDPTDMIILDDGDVLSNYLTLDFKIIELCVYHDGKNKIFGFKAIYMIDGERIEGHDNVLLHIKNQTNTVKTVLKMSKPNDSLKFISGFSHDFIEYIKFESCKGDSIVVGNLLGEKAKDLKEFCFDVKKEEIPTVLFGGLKFNAASNDPNDMQLSYFGVELINNGIYQKWLNRKKAPKEEIEESIYVENEENNTSVLQRRGLVLGKRIPMKKY